MRLQGMVGDSVKIRPAGSGWRPPEWITNPTRGDKVLRGSETRRQAQETKRESFLWTQTQRSDLRHLTNHRNDSSLRTEGESRDVELGLGSGVQADCGIVRKSQRGHHTAKQERRRTRHVRDQNMAYPQRVLALLLSMFVALSLLGMVATLLSTKLDAIETKLDERSVNDLYPRHKEYGEKNTGIFNAFPSNSRRRLLQSDETLLAPSKNVMPSSASSDRPSSLFQRYGTLLRAFSTMARVSELLSEKNEKPSPLIVGNILFGTIASSRIATYPNPVEYTADQLNPAESMPSISRSDLSRNIESESATLETEIKQNLLDMLKGHPVSGFQIPRSITSSQSPKIPGNLNEPPDDEQREGALFYSRGTSNRSVPEANAFRQVDFDSETDAAFSRNFNKPKSWEDLAAPLFPQQVFSATNRAEKRKERNIDQRGQEIHFENQNFEAQTPGAMNKLNTYPEGVEMWEVVPGKWVCRAFRVCRMQDGTVLLPTWMKSHKDRLAVDCGLGKTRFDLEANPNPGNQFAIQNDLRGATKNVSLTSDSSSRDLFGNSAPREHMPHFVSDILRPLVSIETLFGEESRVLSFTKLGPKSATGLPQGADKRFEDVKPTMQLSDGTLRRSPAAWVLSFARLLQDFGFQFTSAGKEKSTDRLSSPAQKGACFRSIVTNNLNQHLPFGLFDSRGKNVLYTASGISREDVAMLTKSPSQLCEVTITALTRKGPRALLRLHELKGMVEQMAQELGISAKFRVVDFSENVSFAEQVQTVQTSNVLIATHGAGNSNFIFMRPRAAAIEIFPFSYRAGPFNSFAKIFGLEYSYAMASPQTEVFKECMNRHEKNPKIKAYVFSEWAKAVQLESRDPGVHRLRFEAEFGEPGKSEGMTARQCARMQELEFDVTRVASTAVDAALQQCHRGAQT